MSIKNLLNSITLLAMIALSGCSEPPPPSLTVGTNQWPGYETLHLANKLHLYDSYPIKLVELTSATDVLNAFKYGQLDVAALTLDEAILLARDVPDLVVFLVMDISNGADKLIAKPYVDGLEDLANKRVGVEQTALGAFFFSQMLKAAELSLTQVTTVPATVDQHLRMMNEGNLDAVVTFEPTASLLMSRGNVSLFDSSQIPDKIVDVLVTTRAKLQSKHDTLLRLVSAQWEALDYLANEPQDAARLMAPRLHISAEQLLLSYEGLLLPDKHQNQTLLSESLSSTASKLNTLMVDEGIITHTIRTNDLITDELVR